MRNRIGSLGLSEAQQLIVLLNKSDLWDTARLAAELGATVPVLTLAARNGVGLDALKDLLIRSVGDNTHDEALIVSNVRHYEALVHASEALERAIASLHGNLPADLISEDVRQVLYHLGTITGEITTDDILGNIFSKFCIGK